MYLNYYTRRILPIWLIFAILPCWLYGYFAKYPIQNFTPTEYKAGIQNIDFAQNRDMTLFVANNLGVLSFNGIAWKTHDFKTGKKKRSLAFDEQSNRLYVGSQGEFGYFEKDWTYVSLVDMIPSDAMYFSCKTKCTSAPSRASIFLMEKASMYSATQRV